MALSGRRGNDWYMVEIVWRRRGSSRQDHRSMGASIWGKIRGDNAGKDRLLSGTHNSLQRLIDREENRDDQRALLWRISLFEL